METSPLSSGTFWGFASAATTAVSLGVVAYYNGKDERAEKRDQRRQGRQEEGRRSSLQEIANASAIADIKRLQDDRDRHEKRAEKLQRQADWYRSQAFLFQEGWRACWHELVNILSNVLPIDDPRRGDPPVRPPAVTEPPT